MVSRKGITFYQLSRAVGAVCSCFARQAHFKLVKELGLDTHLKSNLGEFFLHVQRLQTLDLSRERTLDAELDSLKWYTGYC